MFFVKVDRMVADQLRAQAIMCGLSTVVRLQTNSIDTAQ